jgi:hypothetical protein
MEPSLPPSSKPPAASRFQSYFVLPAIGVIAIVVFTVVRACNHLIESSASFEAVKSALDGDQIVRKTVGSPISVRAGNFCSQTDSTHEVTRYSAWVSGPKGGRNVTAIVRASGSEVRITYLERISNSMSRSIRNV